MSQEVSAGYWRYVEKSVTNIISSVILLLLLVNTPARADSCQTQLFAQSANKLVAAMEPHIKGGELWHGSGCYTELEEEPNRCDWEAEITLDRKIGDNRRLIVINYNHNTGSGAWDYVRIYGCSNEQSAVLFDESYLYGATIEESSNEQIVITGGYWLKDDANCCPSKKIRQIYKWNEDKNKYIKYKHKIIPRRDP